jgi:hypothetical protein
VLSELVGVHSSGSWSSVAMGYGLSMIVPYVEHGR